MTVTIPPLGSAVYVLYLESGPSNTLLDAAERETMGWVAQEIGQYINIQHDRTIENIQYSSGSGSGMLIPKSSILEIYLVKRESE
jgi:hypothetical protein